MALRAQPPTRSEVRDFCLAVLEACPECRRANYRDPDFEPCVMCETLIKSTLEEFTGKLRQAVETVSACEQCRPRMVTVLREGLPSPERVRDGGLCVSCASELRRIYLRDLN